MNVRTTVSYGVKSATVYQRNMFGCYINRMIISPHGLRGNQASSSSSTTTLASGLATNEAEDAATAAHAHGHSKEQQQTGNVS